MEVHDLHPLRRKAKYHHILPFLKPCHKCCGKSEKDDFRVMAKKTILKELGMKATTGEESSSKDPFVMLGYGINAYFDIMLSLFYMFVCIAIFAIPIFMLYSGNLAQGMQEL